MLGSLVATLGRLLFRLANLRGLARERYYANKSERTNSVPPRPHRLPPSPPALPSPPILRDSAVANSDREHLG
eukprot:2127013-Prymnesium_polylepis.1